MTEQEKIKKAIRHFECMRDDAKAVLDTGFGTHEGESSIVYDNRKMYAELAISALEKQIDGDWVPCSERLPTNQTEWWRTTEYLTCGKDGTIQVLCYSDGWNCSFLNADMDVYRYNEIKDIIAWMPLPSPYTENRKES